MRQALTGQAIPLTPGPYFVILELYFIYIQLLLGQFNLLNELKGRKNSSVCLKQLLEQSHKFILTLLTLTSKLQFAHDFKHFLSGHHPEAAFPCVVSQKDTDLTAEAYLENLKLTFILPMVS